MAVIAVHSRALKRSAIPHLSSGGLLKLVLLISLGTVVLVPLILLIVNSFQTGRPGEVGQFSIDGWRIALTQPGILNALWNTATLTIARQSIALVIAILFAWLLGRTDLPGRPGIELAFWTIFFLPVLPMTLGWILLLDPNFGLFNEASAALFGSRFFNVYSWEGIVWVHLVTGTIAVKVVLLVPAFRNLDSSFEEASRVCGANVGRTLWRISIPLVTPAILIVVLMSIAASLQAFEVELILGPQAGIDVYSTIMYRFISNDPAQFGPATVLGVLVMMVMLPFALWQYQLVTRRSHATITSAHKTMRVSLGRWRWPLFGLVVFYLGLALLLPSVLLLMATFTKYFGAFNAPAPWTLQQWKIVLADLTFLRSLVNTLMLGVGAGTLALIWFSLIGYVIVRYRGITARALDLLCWLPWAVPGVIMGLGFLWMVLGIGFLRPLHSTMLIMIVAVMLGSITPGTQMIKAGLIQIDVDLENASRIGGASWFYTFRRIVLPLLTPTLVAVAIFTFVSAVRDVGRLIFVVGGTNRPLALLQLDFMVSERLEAAAVVGVILTLLSVGVAVITRFLGLRFAAEA